MKITFSKAVYNSADVSELISEDIDVGGRIILKRIFEKYGLGVWVGFVWLRIGTGGGLL
jgi:hypothetical protein